MCGNENGDEARRNLCGCSHGREETPLGGNCSKISA